MLKTLENKTLGTTNMFEAPAHDPEFYQAKKALRKMYPDAMMIELLPGRKKIDYTITVVDANGNAVTL